MQMAITTTPSAQGFTSVVTLARATELALDRGDLAASVSDCD